MAGAPEVEVRLEGAAEALRAIDALRAALRSGDPVRRVGRELTRTVLATVIALTPRQHDPASRTGSTRRDFPPVYRGWKAQVIAYARGAVYQSQISNLIEDDTEGRRILLALEHGAPPHRIEPRAGKVLAWNEPETVRRFAGRAVSPTGTVADLFHRREGADGAVFTRGVDHPGHQGFGMIAKTVQQAQRALGPLGDQLLAEYGQIWAGHFNAGVSESL